LNRIQEEIDQTWEMKTTDLRNKEIKLWTITERMHSISLR